MLYGFPSCILQNEAIWYIRCRCFIHTEKNLGMSHRYYWIFWSSIRLVHVRFNNTVCLYFSGNVHVALQVWDIGGQTLGGKMLETYVFGSTVSIYFRDESKKFLPPLIQHYGIKILRIAQVGREIKHSYNKKKSQLNSWL